MKNKLHTKYYLPWKDAKTHIHLKYTKQKTTGHLYFFQKNKQCTEFSFARWSDLNEQSKVNKCNC